MSIVGIVLLQVPHQDACTVASCRGGWLDSQSMLRSLANVAHKVLKAVALWAYAPRNLHAVPQNLIFSRNAAREQHS